jgi:hypothetical protein
MSRPAIALSLAVLAMVGLLAVQVFVTSPNRVTDVEWHLILLASVPALTVVVAAYWVDDGRRR